MAPVIAVSLRRAQFSCPIDALFRAWQSPCRVRNEQFFYEGSREITALIDKAARRAGLSRGQAFEDFLTCVRCALAAGQNRRRVSQDGHSGTDRHSSVLLWV